MSLSGLNASAVELHGELSDRFDLFVSRLDGRRGLKFWNRVGFRFYFNTWVSVVVMLRSVVGKDFSLLRGLNVAWVSSGGVLKDSVSFDNVFLLNKELHDFFVKEYSVDSGDSVEEACLFLLVSGVKFEESNAGVFFELVASGFDVSEAEGFMKLPASYRKQFYS